MTAKLGMNDPCSCGSGREYKECHGIFDVLDESGMPEFFAKARKDGIVVKHHPTGTQFVLGSGGMTIGDYSEHEGIDRVLAAPSEHRAFIVVDIPAFIPVEETAVELTLESGPCRVTIRTKSRGEEEFSSLDTTTLPYFTALRIERNGLVDDPMSILKEVLGYFDDLSTMLKLGLPELRNSDRFSIVVYHQRLDSLQTVARSIYPLTGTHRIPTPSEPVPLVPALQQALNRFRIELTSRAEAQLRKNKEDTFESQLLAILHDFVFFARQHRKTVRELQEEQVRDLFLLPLKAAFRSAEGEVYNYNGKTDIKATDPSNQYNFGVIEFKKWSGPDSFAQAYSQAVREHSSGQEAFLMIVILSENLDLKAVVDASVKEYEKQLETKNVDPRTKIVPSDEPFYRGSVDLRGRSVPLTVGILDLHFTNVRSDRQQ